MLTPVGFRVIVSKIGREVYGHGWLLAGVGRPFQGRPQSVLVGSWVLVGRGVPIRLNASCDPTGVMLQAPTEPLWALERHLSPRLARGRGTQNALALTGTLVVRRSQIVALSLDVQSKTREPSGRHG
jgi:hypothetical protein